jgi:hypothetical protein
MCKSLGNMPLSAFRSRIIVWLLVIMFVSSCLPAISRAQSSAATIRAMHGTVLVNDREVEERLTLTALGFNILRGSTSQSGISEQRRQLNGERHHAAIITRGQAQHNASSVPGSPLAHSGDERSEHIEGVPLLNHGYTRMNTDEYMGYAKYTKRTVNFPFQRLLKLA